MAEPEPAPPAVDGRRRTPATIYDIARALGVSASTVSRALHKPGRVSAQTEARIRAAADELGYRINPMARALPTGRSGTLALVLSDITNPVYFDLVRGAERVASAAGSSLVLAESQESAAAELDVARRLQVSCDGLLLVGSRLDDATVRELAADKPLVLLNRLVEGVPGLAPEVGPGIRAALDHLVGLGHRSLVYLSGPVSSWMSRARWEALLDEAVARGVSIVEVGPGAPTLAGGESSVRRVLASGATAVLAFNDLMAIGLLQACRAAGVDVPGRLSVLGFDDIFGSALTTPAVTTVRSPLGDLGAAGVRDLLARVEGGAPSTPVVLGTELVVRESTAAPAS
ncbi:MAG TPA: LacI family DNA-binding transcriptional regulator [Cellulomonas sp.]